MYANGLFWDYYKNVLHAHARIFIFFINNIFPKFGILLAMRMNPIHKLHSTDGRHEETYLHHTELSIPDCHKVHQHVSYRFFFKTLFYVFKNSFNNFFSTQWQNSFTEDYNYLIIVMNSEFNATESGLLVLHNKRYLKKKFWTEICCSVSPNQKIITELTKLLQNCFSKYWSV